jgi:cytochrome c oxidase subunit 2
MTTQFYEATTVNKAGEYGTLRASGSPIFQIGFDSLQLSISKGEFMKKRFMLLLLVVGIATSGVFSTRAILAQDAPRRIEITAKRFTFNPAEITVKKGQPVILVVKSLDVAHGLRFRDLNLELKVPKAGTAELPFTPNKTGDFVGHCAVFCGAGHGGMALTLHVVE